MDYLSYLRDESCEIQNKLKILLEKYKVQPAGHGYIDLIVGKELLEAFINELTNHNIIVAGVTWWCHCTTESELLLGCPHGMGGPRSNYYQGWFSEVQNPMYEISKQVLDEINLSELHDNVKSINKQVLQYVREELNQNKSYLECLVPALWLYVPDEWKSL